MKHISKFALLFLAGGIAACSQDPQSADGPNLPLATHSGGGGSTPAHPALTFSNQVNEGSNHNPILYWDLQVSDSDGSHITTIYTASSTSEEVSNPTWSPDGNSICFLDINTSSNFTRSIKAIDVSVNSSGVTVGSNLRTIFASSASDSVIIANPRWCQNGSTGEIVFSRLHDNYTERYLSEICTVSQSGGTPSVVTSIQGSGHGADGRFSLPCWSPDDSKIAARRQDTTISGVIYCTIMIFNASTGAATDSISLHSSALNPGVLVWSHTGMNELAFGANGDLYYCAPATGSTPSTNSVTAQLNCWSPTNSSLLMGGQGAALQKNTTFTSSLSNIASAFYDIPQIDWKH